MPGGLPRAGFGIKKVDPKELKEQTLQISSYKDYERGRGAIQDLEQLQLISYCLGTAPSKYKMDMASLSSSLLNLFGQVELKS